jgi:hypothetical protein
MSSQNKFPIDFLYPLSAISHCGVTTTLEADPVTATTAIVTVTDSDSSSCSCSSTSATATTLTATTLNDAIVRVPGPVVQSPIWRFGAHKLFDRNVIGVIKQFYISGTFSIIEFHGIADRLSDLIQMMQ